MTWWFKNERISLIPNCFDKKLYKQTIGIKMFLNKHFYNNKVQSDSNNPSLSNYQWFNNDIIHRQQKIRMTRNDLPQDI